MHTVACIGEHKEDREAGTTMDILIPQLQAIKDDIEQVAQDAYTFAEESPVPDPATLYDHVYAGA